MNLVRTLICNDPNDTNQYPRVTWFDNKNFGIYDADGNPLYCIWGYNKDSVTENEKDTFTSQPTSLFGKSNVIRPFNEIENQKGTIYFDKFIHVPNQVLPNLNTTIQWLDGWQTGFIESNKYHILKTTTERETELNIQDYYSTSVYIDANKNVVLNTNNNLIRHFDYNKKTLLYDNFQNISNVTFDTVTLSKENKSISVDNQTWLTINKITPFETSKQGDDSNRENLKNQSNEKLNAALVL